MLQEINKLTYERIDYLLKNNDQEGLSRAIIDVIDEASSAKLTAFVMTNCDIEKRADTFRAIAHLFSTTLGTLCEKPKLILTIWRLFEVLYILGTVDAVLTNKSGYLNVIERPDKEYWNEIRDLL